MTHTKKDHCQTEAHTLTLPALLPTRISFGNLVLIHLYSILRFPLASYDAVVCHVLTGPAT